MSRIASFTGDHRIITIEGARGGYTVYEKGDGIVTPGYLRRMAIFTNKEKALTYARAAARAPLRRRR